MSNIVASNLVALKEQITPHITFAINTARDIKDKISEYSLLLLKDQQHTTAEDILTLDELVEAVRIMQIQNDHVNDLVKTIGQPRIMERYFNNVNGELVEVSREEYAGKDIPDDDDIARDLPD